MRLVLDRSGTVNRGAFADPYQTITLSGAAATVGTRIRSYGTTTIVPGGSGATKTVELANPIRKGVVKRIIVNTKASSVDVAIVTQSTLSQIGGSTYNNVAFSTGGARQKFITLVAATTRNWDISGLSTGVTFSKTSSPY